MDKEQKQKQQQHIIEFVILVVSWLLLPLYNDQPDLNGLVDGSGSSMQK